MKTFEEVRANTYEYYTYALLNARQELSQAHEYYREIPHSDKVAKAEAYVSWNEMHRDAGYLIEESGKVRFLEDNQHYQSAKETCSGKSI